MTYGGYDIVYCGAALLLVLPPVLSFVLLSYPKDQPMYDHLALCSGDRCTLDDCLCDCHATGPTWTIWRGADRVAYAVTRFIIVAAVIYLIAVILALAWTS